MGSWYQLTAMKQRTCLGLSCHIGVVKFWDASIFWFWVLVHSFARYLYVTSISIVLHIISYYYTIPYFIIGKSREPLILKDLTKLIGLVLNPFIIGALGPGALIISISQGLRLQQSANRTPLAECRRGKKWGHRCLSQSVDLSKSADTETHMFGVSINGVSNVL